MSPTLSLVLVPEISISLASPEEPTVEPFSPFTPDSPAFRLADDDEYRPTLLSPPPIVSPKFIRQLSPLRPIDASNPSKGLERERFDAILQACKDRNATVAAKKSPDLRKEIALKAHKTKQSTFSACFYIISAHLIVVLFSVERRTLFLSKVKAPPSPSAAITPKTPPESPAIFHYSLPSPGLESPLEMFESLSLDHSHACLRKPWVEQVDFRLPREHCTRVVSKPEPGVQSRKPLPSLDQITARMSSHGVVPVQEIISQPRVAMRLPAFLQSDRRTPLQNTPRVIITEPSSPEFIELPSVSQFTHKQAIRFYPPPELPKSTDLRVITTVVPKSSHVSPVRLTEANVNAFNHNVREDTARRMLLRLRRRTLPPLTSAVDFRTFMTEAEQEQDRKSRRRSAPPELQERERSGFTHAILQLPGAF